MANCPQCNTTLGPSDLLALRCRKCGTSLASLPEVDLASRTLDEKTSPLTSAEFGRTIDEQLDPLTPRQSLSGAAGGATLPDAAVVNPQAFGQTLPSISGGDRPPPTGRIDQTLDSNTFPSLPLDSGVGDSTIPKGRLDQTLDSKTFPSLPLDSAAGDSTMPTGRLDQTLDSDTFPVLPPREEGGTVQNPRLDQTFDSDSFPSVPEEKGPPTVHDARLNQTLDSNTFPPLPPQGPGTVHDMGLGGTLGGAPSAREKTGGTVHDHRVDQTIDSTSFEDALSEERKTVGERRLMQTLDSVGSVSEIEGKEPGTVGARRTAQTMDSAVLASADLAKVSQMWEGSYTGRDTPMTSIKAQAPATEIPENTLHVALRVFRGAGIRTTKPADYDLLKQLGEGGMGIVYKARQASIDRTVAIKTLKPKTAKDKHTRDKFLAEAVVTGELDHPNIVPIYDLGTNEEGALFYSMKMVQGTPWMEEIKKKSLHANIEILMKVADAIAFAHSRDVVHRDLKPENIMLGGFGEVLVMDWGLAIYTIRSKRPGGIKQSVSMGGTPAYMAPEMAQGPFELICPASDVYLLGAMLYEIVTGKPPHTGADVMKCLFAAAKNQIQPTEVKSELVEIALKAMATKIEDRYATVQIFQDAIREYLSHSESIVLSTRADDDLQRASKTNDYQDFAQARFGFQKALEMWSGNVRARVGLSEANLAYATSALHKGDLDLGLSLLDLENPQHEEIVGQIKAAQHEREARQHRLKTMRRAMIGGVVTFLVTVILAFGAITYAMIDANTQKKLAVTAGKKALDEKKLADEAKDEALQQKKAAEEQRIAADKAKDEAKIAEGKAVDEKKAADKARDDAKLAEARAVDEKKAADAAKDKAEVARQNAVYQEYIAVIGLAAAKINENAHGRAKEMLEKYKDQPDLINWEWGRLMRLCSQSVTDYASKDKDKIEAVAFDSSGERFVSGGWNGRAYVWKVQGGEPVVIETGGSRVNAVAFSPAQDMVATGGDSEQSYIRLWNGSTGMPLGRDLKTDPKVDPQTLGFAGHTAAVLSLSFSKDGKQLLSSSADGTARLWNVETGDLIKTFKGHIDPVQAAVFSPREDRLVTVSDDGTALVWVVATGEKSPPFYGHEGPVYAAAFSPDGSRIATGGYDKRVLVWDPSELKPFDYKKHSEEYRKRLEEQKGQGGSETAGAGLQKFKISLGQKIAELSAHTDRVQSVRFSADGKFLFSAGHDNAVNVWDANRAWTDGSKSLLKTLRGHDSPVRACAVTSDGSLVLSGSYDGIAKLWDVRKYEEVRVLLGTGPHHAEEVLAASFVGEGDQMRILTASQDRTAKIWRLDAAQKQASLVDEKRFVEEKTFVEGHEFLASTAVFLDGGKKIITGGVDQSARIWDVSTGTELRKLKGTGGNAVAVVSPDGKWILTGANSNAALLWNAVNDDPPIVLEGHEGPITAIAFSPDSSLFYTGDKNGRGRLWKTASHEPVGPDLKGHSAAIMGAIFLPDNKHLLTASGDNHVGHWDLSVMPAARVGKLTLHHPKGVKSLGLTSDGRYALTSCEDDQVRLWDVPAAKVLRTISVPGSARSGRGPVGSVVFSHDNRRAAFVVDEDRTVREFLVDPASTEAPKILLNLGELGVYVRSAIFSPDDSSILTVGGNEARLWDAMPPEAGKPANERMRFSPNDVVASASFSPDRKRVVTASWDFTARIWNTQTGLDELQLKGHTDHVNSALFSPDGRFVLTASDDRTARLWDAVSGQQLMIFTGHEGGVRWASYSNDKAGSRVLTASNDKKARLWDAELKVPVAEIKEPILVEKPLGMLEGHEAEVLHVDFSHDDTRIVTGSRDNTARIWDAKTLKLLQTLVGHTAGVNSVAFSPDGKRVLTGSEDFTAKIWDSDKGQEVLTLKGHEREVTSVAFSSDGLYALTGSRDNKAIVWTANDWKGAAKPPVEAAADLGRGQ